MAAKSNLEQIEKEDFDDEIGPEKVKKLNRQNLSLRNQLKQVNTSLTVFLEHVSSYNMKKKAIAHFQPVDELAHQFNQGIDIRETLKGSMRGTLSPGPIRANISLHSSMGNQTLLTTRGSPVRNHTKSLMLEDLHQQNMSKMGRNLQYDYDKL